MMWKDLQFEGWIDRGQTEGKELAETDGEKFARLMRESGAKL